jgi:hypothetical protein
MICEKSMKLIEDSSRNFITHMNVNAILIRNH